MALDIELPANGWMPREYQIPLWGYMEEGGRRACIVWHRRAGKDTNCLEILVAMAHERIGTYWHMLPEAAQGRKVVWDALTRDGLRLIDNAIPLSLRTATNNTEMKVTLKCGSIIQVVGSDNYNSLIGSNPVGIVFSEYSVADPQAWEFLRPILVENGGWAIFIFTPRGRTHGFKLFQVAKRNPEWFSQILTIDDTAERGGTVTPAMVQQEIADGMDEDLANQEYWCSFQAAIHGAYYGKLMVQAETEKRICGVPWDPSVPVETWWDLGFSDSTAIWFVQHVQRRVHIIDYYESSGVGIEHYVKILNERPYVYGRHLMPFDARSGNIWTGEKGTEILRKLGLKNVIVIPKLTPEDGIQAVRRLLPRCYFDEIKTERGVLALQMYRREYDQKLADFKAKALHDWASHGADAFRYGAVGTRTPDAVGYVQTHVLDADNPHGQYTPAGQGGAISNALARAARRAKEFPADPVRPPQTHAIMGDGS